MSKPLKGCCRIAISNMINQAALGSALQVFLAASPFILILPDLIPPGSASEAAEIIAEKLVQMPGEKVVENVTKTASLPDFADAVRAVNEISLNYLHIKSFTHSNSHARGITEGRLWEEFKRIYNAKGNIRSGGGWDLNPFW